MLQVSVPSTETNKSTNSIQFPVYRFVVKKHYLAEVANEVPFDYFSAKNTKNRFMYVNVI